MSVKMDEEKEIRDLIRAWASRRKIILGEVSIADLAKDMEKVERHARVRTKIKMIDELEVLIKKLREEAVREM